MKGGLLLRYWEECKFIHDDSIYSCDMVRFNVVFRSDCMDSIVNLYNGVKRWDDVTIYPTSFASFKYRQLIVIKVAESTVSVGIGFNGTNKEDMFKGFIEFNPNKVFPEWFDEFCILRSYCVDCNITRMDVAIDIPVARRFVTLRKDNRIYEYKMKSIEDRTEYLGRRNNPGRIKLYNKKLESELDMELTRLEITTEADIFKFVTHKPVVYLGAEYEQLCFDDFKENGLNPTNICIVNMLNEFDLQKKKEFLQQLPYYMRKKIEPYVLPDKEFQLDISTCAMLIDKMRTLMI